MLRHPITFSQDVATAGTAVQLPSNSVPQDCFVTIKAKSTNTGTIYIGGSKADAEDTANAFPLSAGEKQDLKIKNSSGIWINASVNGEGVNIIIG